MTLILEEKGLKESVVVAFIRKPLGLASSSEEEVC